MKTDKNTLFRAIGEIDEKYVSEILEEDASGMNVIKSFDAAKAATNAKKNSSGVKKFFMYYLPAVAGLLVCAVIVKSFMTSRDSCASAPSASADSAAPVECAPMAEVNSVDAAAEEANYEDECDSAYDMTEAATTSETAGARDDGTYSGKDDTLTFEGMPNPFIDCESLEEACEISGIELNIPDDFSFGFDRIYRAMDGRMIEVIFMEGDTEVYRIRKGLVSELGEDISGDYNIYSVGTNIEYPDYSVEIHGDDEDTAMNAVWNDGRYAYSVTCEEPIPTVSMTGIVEMIMAD